MWILILTMTTISTGGGVSIEHIPGFASKEACVVAGNAWLDSMQNRNFIRITSLCVHSGYTNNSK